MTRDVGERVKALEITGAIEIRDGVRGELTRATTEVVGDGHNP
jgi:hypothetical protein